MCFYIATVSYVTKFLEISKNSGIRGSDILQSIPARKIEKVVKVTFKEK